MAKKPTYEELEKRVLKLEADESELKARLEVLQKSEKSYRYLFENMLHEVHIWEFIFDEYGTIKTWRLVDANPAALKSWGKSLPEIIGKSTDEIFPDSNATELFMPIMNKIYNEGVPHTWESYFPDTNQLLRMISIPIGKYFISTGFDITDRKQTEEILHKSHEMLKRTEAMANIGSWEWDVQHDQVHWSEELFRIFGRHPAEGEPPFAEQSEFYVNEDFQCLRDAVETCVKRGTSYEIEVRAIRTDGEIRHCVSKGHPQCDENGKVFQIFGSFQDITDRKNSEIQIKSLERQNQALLDHSPVCHKIVDLDFNLQYMSKNGFEMLKLDHNADVYGKPYPFYFFPEAFKNKMIESLKKVKETGQMRTMEALTNDIEGNEVWLDSSLIPVLDDNNRIDYITVVSDNVTQRKQDEKEKERFGKNLRQSQKMESIGTLAGGIAHDFNNILFPIIGYTQMLLEDVPKDSPFTDSLKTIYTSALRAKSLVKQILTFSRQESSELMLMKMQPIVKEALKLIRSTIPTTIGIKQDINPDCGVIKADPTQIHQIVMNLATNAYHAMEDTGGELKVRLKEIELGEYDILRPNMKPGIYVCLTITDTGRGMDKELTRKIFDPFFTTKEKGKGTGMGLSVVHGIVTAMGGAINVYSEPGKGTEFHVYLPVEKSLSEEQLITSKVQIQGGTEQILLVDDEEAILTMEKRMLERLGYQVTSRFSSLEALESFRTNSDKFDLVVTDMAMPNMPGDKLSVELTKIRPDIPVLLCTGFSETMSEEKAASLGIKGFLMKPIVMRDLAQKIREVLDKK